MSLGNCSGVTPLRPPWLYAILAITASLWLSQAVELRQQQ